MTNKSLALFERKFVRRKKDDKKHLTDVGDTETVLLVRRNFIRY